MLIRDQERYQEREIKRENTDPLLVIAQEIIREDEPTFLEACRTNNNRSLGFLEETDDVSILNVYRLFSVVH